MKVQQELCAFSCCKMIMEPVKINIWGEEKVFPLIPAARWEKEQNCECCCQHKVTNSQCYLESADMVLHVHRKRGGGAKRKDIDDKEIPEVGRS